MFIFPKPPALHDFEARYRKSVALKGADELRKEVEIVAIDDLQFSPETNLKNSNFKISVLRDIQRIIDVEKYSIILCDINGVGTSLSQDTQGAYVIEEIKRAYPEKIVIAYTAGSASSKLVQRARQMADGYLRKDASIEDWRDLLDEKIRILADPVASWKKLRLRLLQADIELVDLIELEKIFIANFPKGAQATRQELSKRLTSANASSHWRGEVTKFIGSKAFDFAFSAVIESGLKGI